MEAVPGGLQSRPHGIKRSCEKRALLRRALIPMLPSGDADVVVIALANLFATVFESAPPRSAGSPRWSPGDDWPAYAFAGLAESAGGFRPLMDAVPEAVEKRILRPQLARNVFLRACFDGLPP